MGLAAIDREGLSAEQILGHDVASFNGHRSFIPNAAGSPATYAKSSCHCDAICKYGALFHVGV
jgi:hypothetical protein